MQKTTYPVLPVFPLSFVIDNKLEYCVVTRCRWQWKVAFMRH